MRSRAMRLGAIALAALLGGSLAACGNDAGGTTTGGGNPAGLTVEVDPGSVPPGGKLAASVVNETGRQFTYGAGYELEREVDGAFEPVDLGDRAVIQIGYVAKPGGTGPPVRVEIPKDAEPGVWRVIVARDVPGAGDLSAEFEVTDG